MRTRWLGLGLLVCLLAACELAARPDGSEQNAVTGEGGAASAPRDGVVTVIGRDGGLDAGADAVDAAVADEDGGVDASDPDACVPSAELELCINELDDDCDGETDEGCECAPGDTRPCYTGAEGTQDVGECRSGEQTCEKLDGAEGTTWGACEGEVLPAANTCDGVDRACMGDPLIGCACELGAQRECYTGSSATRDVGACQDGLRTCMAVEGVAAWGDSCEGEVTPNAEVCGNAVDEDCDGELDDGCASLVCPADTNVLAGQMLGLDVVATGVSALVWELRAGPTGGIGTAAFTTSGTHADLTPVIVGDYEVSVRGRDARNVEHACSLRVRARPHGLRVQLFWDGAGDVDLHLHNGTANPWFSTSDCYYGNQDTTWGAVHVLDETIENGPEVVRVDTPVVGTRYTVGVHNYGSATGRTATVQVFCGDTSIAPELTLTSSPFASEVYGECDANDFWTVARVTFATASSCTVEIVGTYRTSAAACAAY